MIEEMKMGIENRIHYMIEEKKKEIMEVEKEIAEGQIVEKEDIDVENLDCESPLMKGNPEMKNALLNALPKTAFIMNNIIEHVQ